VIAVWQEPWFWPALAVIVGLPIVLIVLGELQESLANRASPAARVVRLVRNLIAPVAALLVLVSLAEGAEVEGSWTRIVATVLGFLVIVVLINGLNVALFVTARKGSWRDRLPSIFIDVGRFLLITIAIAVNTAVSRNAEGSCIDPASAWPIARARPVESASAPIDRPPPNSSTIPQSMRAASSQLIVNLRAAHCTGSRNSRIAPIIAAIDSGTSIAYVRAIWLSPKPAIANRPGISHNSTVVKKASMTLRCPRVTGPSFFSSSRTSAALPSPIVTPRTART